MTSVRGTYPLVHRVAAPTSHEGPVSTIGALVCAQVVQQLKHTNTELALAIASDDVHPQPPTPHASLTLQRSDAVERSG
jgi:hypothetical protein